MMQIYSRRLGRFGIGAKASDKIRNLAQNCGVSNGELAEICDISPSSISRFLNARMWLSRVPFERLEAFLELELVFDPPPPINRNASKPKEKPKPVVKFCGYCGEPIRRTRGGRSKCCNKRECRMAFARDTQTETNRTRRVRQVTIALAATNSAMQGA